jgi:hypothetical protein
MKVIIHTCIINRPLTDNILSVVVKNPSDFVGAFLGQTEKNTKAILDSTVGKVLVIDEVCNPRFTTR